MRLAALRSGAMSTSKIRVAVVFGGRSSEHAISCATASGVLGAIDRDRFEVVPIGISPQGEWVLAADDPDRWALGAGQESGPVVGAEQGAVMVPFGDGSKPLLVRSAGQVPRELASVDVVFPLLHGPFGEDGTVQGLLELAGLPYVGSGVLASAVGMDKHFMKAVLRDAGLPVGRSVTVSRQWWARAPQEVEQAAAQLGWPVFVKPSRAGSRVGISKVDGPDDLAGAIAVAQGHDPKVLIAEAISGRGIECGVLGGREGGRPRVTAPGEIAIGQDGGFYDFEAKYFDTGEVELLYPAPVPQEISEQAQELAVATFEALDCEGLARVDFFYTDSGQLLVNEINTMPGFTPYSMFPMLWQRTGMTYAELISELIELALQRPTGLR